MKEAGQPSEIEVMEESMMKRVFSSVGMPFGNAPASPALCPEGTLENSPTFQRWVTYDKELSPEGTAEGLDSVSAVPSELTAFLHRFPMLKHWATFALSLRDKAL